MINKLKNIYNKHFKKTSQIKRKYNIQKLLKKRNYNEKLLARTFINILTEFKFYNRALKKYKEFDIRLPILPEFLSEILVYFAIRNILKDTSVTRKCIGDLASEEYGRIEVKGFSSTAPNSFSTNMKWDSLFFVDCKTIENDNNVIIYKVLMSLNDFKNLIYVSKTKTFADYEKSKQRAKISFDNLTKQKKFVYEIVFQGNYKNLLSYS